MYVCTFVQCPAEAAVTNSLQVPAETSLSPVQSFVFVIRRVPQLVKMIDVSALPAGSSRFTSRERGYAHTPHHSARLCAILPQYSSVCAECPPDSPIIVIYCSDPIPRQRAQLPDWQRYYGHTTILQRYRVKVSCCSETVMTHAHRLSGS
nr:hypothetical protein CFP56_02511 [Quercus suber]